MKNVAENPVELFSFSGITIIPFSCFLTLLKVASNPFIFIQQSCPDSQVLVFLKITISLS